MAPKRKSEVLDSDSDPAIDLTGDEPTLGKDNAGLVASAASTSSVVSKKPRLSDAVGQAAPSSPSSGTKKKATAGPKDWREIILEGEDEGDVPIYDDCNEIRRKIRVLQKQPGFKITHWLKDIGGINSNSFQRFMKASGSVGGAGNGTYYAAYVYFEKVRIAEGKKKTTKRKWNEEEYVNGMPREDRRNVLVFVPVR